MAPDTVCDADDATSPNLDNAPPKTFPALPTVSPANENAEDNALSKTPPTVVELPLDADEALATTPNAVYVFPSASPSAFPMVENNPPLSCCPDSPVDGDCAACCAYACGEDGVNASMAAEAIEPAMPMALLAAVDATSKTPLATSDAKSSPD